MFNRLLRLIIGLIIFCTFPIVVVIHLVIWVLTDRSILEELNDWIFDH